MKFIFEKPSLTHLALVNTAISLWKSCNFHSFGELFFQTYGLTYNPLLTQTVNCRQWRKVEKQMCKRADELTMLPKTVRQLLVPIMKHIGYELKQWLIYLNVHVFVTNRDVHYNNTVLDICQTNSQWTSQGKIDIVKSAQILSRHESLTFVQRYTIACTFCLTDELSHLKLDVPVSMYHKYPRLQYKILDLFSNPLGCGLSALPRHEKTSLFTYAANNENECATKYIWSKLSDDEKFDCFNGEMDSNDRNNFNILGKAAIMCLILSDVSEHRICYLHSEDCKIIAEYFLKDWVYIEFLLPIMKLMRMDDKEKAKILYKTIQQMMKFNTAKYEEVFTYLLTKPSTEFKKYVIRREQDVSRYHFTCCRVLCKLEDFCNLKLLFEDFSEIDIRKCLSSCFNTEFFNWIFMEKVARFFISSDEQILLFKKYCVSSVSSVYPYINNDDDQWCVIDRYIRYTFSNEQSDGRKLFFDLKCKEFLLYGVECSGEKYLEIIGKFAKWCNLSDNEFEQQKRDIINNSYVDNKGYHHNTYSEVALIFNSLFYEQRFVLLDKIFCWGLLTSEEIIQIKNLIFLTLFDYGLEYLLLGMCEMEFLNRCLNWVFNDQKMEIDQIKRMLPYNIRIARFLDIYKYQNTMRKFLNICSYENMSLEGVRSLKPTDKEIETLFATGCVPFWILE
jgi:hypothetical protein